MSAVRSQTRVCWEHLRDRFLSCRGLSSPSKMTVLAPLLTTACSSSSTLPGPKYVCASGSMCCVRLPTTCRTYDGRLQAWNPPSGMESAIHILTFMAGLWISRCKQLGVLGHSITFKPAASARPANSSRESCRLYCIPWRLPEFAAPTPTRKALSGSLSSSSSSA
jgi:hypothetical protein